MSIIDLNTSGISQPPKHFFVDLIYSCPAYQIKNIKVFPLYGVAEFQDPFGTGIKKLIGKLKSLYPVCLLEVFYMLDYIVYAMLSDAADMPVTEKTPVGATSRGRDREIISLIANIFQYGRKMQVR